MSLSLAKQLLSQYEGSPIYNEISHIIDFLSDSQGIGKADLLKRVAMPPLPKVLVNELVWKIVMECLQKNTILKFDYNGRWNTSTTHRMLRPYQVLLQEGMYFVFGYDENADGGKGDERLFNLSRMKNLENTGRSFELPKDFEFASRYGGGRFGAFIEEEQTTTIKFTSSQSAKVLEWVLSQGVNARPIAPAEFVERWENEIRGLSKYISER